MSNTDAIRDEILAALEKQYTHRGVQPGDITVKMFMEWMKAKGVTISEDKARRVINSEVEAGRLVPVEGGRWSPNGKPVRAWRRPE